MMPALQTLVDNGLTDSALDTILADLIENDGFEDDDDNRCCVALAWYRENEGKADPDTCSIWRDNRVEVDGAEYWVLTDAEADDAFNDYLESCLDDGCVEGADGPYFDREAWKKDASMDGRGCLSGVDGEEGEEGDYFLYRTN
jgi:hypothetical protein